MRRIRVRLMLGLLLPVAFLLNSEARADVAKVIASAAPVGRSQHITSRAGLHYALLSIDRSVVVEVAGPVIRVSIGDLLQVSIFEAEGEVASGNFVTLPSQVVDCSGTIFVPHAGQIAVAGRMLTEIQSDIEARLATRAIDPRVVVALLEPSWVVLLECRASHPLAVALSAVVDRQ